MCVSIFSECKAEKYLSVAVTDLSMCVRVCVRVCVCVFLHPCGCVSVSDRCVGSGLQSCWQCDLALLSLVCTPGPRRSRTAGTAPGRGCLSCGGACTPGPLSAQAYRCETRNVWHSRDLQSSLPISGTYHPLGLGVVEGMTGRCIKINHCKCV